MSGPELKAQSSGKEELEKRQVLGRVSGGQKQKGQEQLSGGPVS